MTTHSHRTSSGQSWLAMLLAVSALMGCLFLWSEARADAPAQTGPQLRTADLAEYAGNRPKALMARDLPRAWGHLRPASKATATLSGPLLRETALVPARSLTPALTPAAPQPGSTARSAPQPPLWLLLTGAGAALSLLGIAGTRPRRLW